MFINILVLLALLDAVVAITTFVLYGRARMQEQEGRENRFLKIHYITLFVLLLLGLVFMFFMVETSD